MKQIRFWTSQACKSPRTWAKWLCLDKTQFELVHDPVNPDYLFVGEAVWYSRRKRLEFLSMLTSKRISIYYAMEAVAPDLNLFDYAVAHDRTLRCGDRVCRCPVLAFNNLLLDGSFNGLRVLCEHPLIPSIQKGFCSFLYSNPKAHPRRDWLFHTLSSYKRVDSLGPHLQNTPIRTTRFERNWTEIAIDLKSGYKFDIASENARYSGYTTEKILSSFMARTLPVYWGNPLIADDFNPNAFVNTNDMDEKALLQTIKSIDEDRALYEKYLSEPPMTSEQLMNNDKEFTIFWAWTNHIFAQSIGSCRRRPEGTWADIYRRAEHSAIVRFWENHNWTALPGKIRTNVTRKLCRFFAYWR